MLKILYFLHLYIVIMFLHFYFQNFYIMIDLKIGISVYFEFIKTFINMKVLYFIVKKQIYFNKELCI